MKNIIIVNSPNFYVNKDNPYDISYDQILFNNPNWKLFVVGYFGSKLPILKNYELLYQYENNRGYIIDGREYRKNKINKLINKLKTKKNVSNYGTNNWN